MGQRSGDREDEKETRVLGVAALLGSPAVDTPRLRAPFRNARKLGRADDEVMDAM